MLRLSELVRSPAAAARLRSPAMILRLSIADAPRSTRWRSRRSSTPTAERGEALAVDAEWPRLSECLDLENRRPELALRAAPGGARRTDPERSEERIPGVAHRQEESGDAIRVSALVRGIGELHPLEFG